MYKSMMALIAGLGLLGLVAAPPLAHADVITTGTFHFTVTSGSPAPTGSFVWNATTGTWNSFTVDWDGVVFDLAPRISDLSFLERGEIWCGAGELNFTVYPCAVPGNFNLGSIYSPATDPFAFTDQLAGAYGYYAVTTTTTTTAVPEPGPLGMMFAGLGVLGLFLTRRRVRRL